MYKKQMKIQKIVCFLVLAASVVVFLYSLGIMTDLYDHCITQFPTKTIWTAAVLMEPVFIMTCSLSTNSC